MIKSLNSTPIHLCYGSPVVNIVYVFSWLSSLMMCGVVAVMLEHYKEAQIFLERATSVDPPSVVAWTLLGQFGALYLVINVGAKCWSSRSFTF